MRRNYIITYDICDPKRLRKVFRTCKGYGNHLQLSVFECDLNASERVLFEAELAAIIKHDEDQVIFVDLGPVEARGERIISSVGKQYTRFDEPCYIA